MFKFINRIPGMFGEEARVKMNNYRYLLENHAIEATAQATLLRIGLRYRIADGFFENHPQRYLLLVGRDGTGRSRALCSISEIPIEVGDIRDAIYMHLIHGYDGELLPYKKLIEILAKRGYLSCVYDDTDLSRHNRDKLAFYTKVHGQNQYSGQCYASGIIGKTDDCVLNIIAVSDQRVYECLPKMGQGLGRFNVIDESGTLTRDLMIYSQQQRHKPTVYSDELIAYFKEQLLLANTQSDTDAIWIRFTEEAAEYYSDMDDRFIYNVLNKRSDQVRNMACCLDFNIEHLAALIAIGVNSREPLITTELLQLAEEYTLYHLNRLVKRLYPTEGSIRL